MNAQRTSPDPLSFNSVARQTRQKREGFVLGKRVPLFRRTGSWSQCMRERGRGLSMNLTWERRRLAGVVMSSGPDVEVHSMNRLGPRQVLDCASPLALWRCRRDNRKRQRTGAVQDAIARSAGSWSQCVTGIVSARKIGESPLPTRRGSILIPAIAPPLTHWGVVPTVWRQIANMNPEITIEYCTA